MCPGSVLGRAGIAAGISVARSQSIANTPPGAHGRCYVLFPPALPTSHRTRTHHTVTHNPEAAVAAIQM
eukprot:m.359401 g.359401  ORF g.359401 m.359401 type:complete len:69 (-) comp28043_c1_seq5:90-296(-)